MPKFIIYKATLPCGRSYIGKTRRGFNKRIAEHLRAARSFSIKTRFAEALSKVKPSDVDWSILHEVLFEEGGETESKATKDAADLEIAAMEYYGTVQVELGFNAHYHSDRIIRSNGQTLEGAQSFAKIHVQNIIWQRNTIR